MRSVVLAIGVFSIVYCWALVARQTPVEQSTLATKPTPLILAANEGEERAFRTRPGVTFTVKIDPRNGGSEHMAVVTEDMAPGDRIPIHRHPHADERNWTSNTRRQGARSARRRTCIHSARHMDWHGEYREGALNPY